MGNENAYRIIKSIDHPNNTNGIDNTDYFYENVGYGNNIHHFFTSEIHARSTVGSSAFTKGVIDGIHQFDSDAVCLISDTRANTGYFSFLNLMDVNFDAIGWNWYSSFGSIINVAANNENHGLITGWNIYDMLNSVTGNKPIWITEVSRTHGSSINQNFDEQSDYIRESMEEIYQLPNIKAYIVYELLDGSNGTSKVRITLV